MKAKPNLKNAASSTEQSADKISGASKRKKGSKTKRSQDPLDIQKRALELEQKLHLADLHLKTQNSLWCSPLVLEMLDLVGDQLGIPNGDVANIAIIMLYRQCFSDERRSVSELGMLLKNLECQVEELGMEIQSLEVTALTAVELELSPYHGSQEFDQ
ncbi:hypothetical protein QEH59_11710 [Coraliomargarita sp. SDUM461004]|uniref:Uncharacterized protein n=1 Tax=Thalassobacterium sedimentorum TaxID=3041258 RepID=A0ABU1AJV1_9BACT|nr:hypothetical protein [Coraliomargarita sp. SDUM461004]MDQ8195095.1 hypothetical protein [Coraliomargarita sp. SDUM461004]